LARGRGTDWLRRGQRSPITDVAEALISVTDVKHYLYCPRIVYFERVLHSAAQLGSQQAESRELHEEHVSRELRRRGAIYYSPEFAEAEKQLFVALSSPALGLQGVVDCVIRLPGECVPVDYKNTASNRGRAWTDHRYQLVAYALLIEENYAVPVRRGFISYLPEKLVVPLAITPTMKTHVKRVIGHVKAIIREEKLPPIRVAKQKCTGGCGHKEICRGES